MAWKVSFTKEAEKSFSKLDKYTQATITTYLRKRIMVSENPRDFGKALAYNKKGFWRYRVGNYRLICKIVDEELVVIIIDVGHRKDIYGSGN
jgi:mRNA interferase RelE/StbE